MTSPSTPATTRTCAISSAHFRKKPDARMPFTWHSSQHTVWSSMSMQEEYRKSSLWMTYSVYKISSVIRSLKDGQEAHSNSWGIKVLILFILSIVLNKISTFLFNTNDILIIFCIFVYMGLQALPYGNQHGHYRKQLPLVHRGISSTHVQWHPYPRTWVSIAETMSKCDRDRRANLPKS